MERAGEWKFSRVATPVQCATTVCIRVRVRVCLRGLLFLMNRLELSLSSHNPFSKPGPPGFSFPVRRDIVICTIKKKGQKGPPAVGVLQYLLFTSAPIQPPSTTPKHTHALPPLENIIQPLQTATTYYLT